MGRSQSPTVTDHWSYGFSGLTMSLSSARSRSISVIRSQMRSNNGAWALTPSLIRKAAASDLLLKIPVCTSASRLLSESSFTRTITTLSRAESAESIALPMDSVALLSASPVFWATSLTDEVTDEAISSKPDFCRGSSFGMLVTTMSSSPPLFSSIITSPDEFLSNITINLLTCIVVSKLRLGKAQGSDRLRLVTKSLPRKRLLHYDGELLLLGGSLPQVPAGA